MLFRIDTEGKAAEAVAADSFSQLHYHERYDIQEWVLHNPQLLGESLLVITSEFSSFDRTSERLDVLALDRSGKLVVVELKRTATRTTAELQALRYAAYCSTLTLQDIVEMRSAFSTGRNVQLTHEQAREEIRAFVESPDFEELNDKPRIIIAADDFGPELTSAVLWLRSFEVDIRCVRLTPYSVNGTLVVDSTVLIPLPEAEEFVIRREKKDATRSSAGNAGVPALEEFIAGVPEPVRARLVRLRERILGGEGMKERVFKTLLSYRRAADNAWVTWLQFTRTQARFGLPDGGDYPPQMIAGSRNGWTTLAVNDDEELEIAIGLIDERLRTMGGV